MYGAEIEMTDEDFEFAKPPLSRNFILRTFEKYELEYIAHFGGEMFYVSRQDSEPMIPVYADSHYQEEIELILDFMARERIRRLRYENGTLFRSAVPELSHA